MNAIVCALGALNWFGLLSAAFKPKDYLTCSDPKREKSRQSSNDCRGCRLAPGISRLGSFEEK